LTTFLAADDLQEPSFERYSYVIEGYPRLSQAIIQCFTQVEENAIARGLYRLWSTLGLIAAFRKEEAEDMETSRAGAARPARSRDARLSKTPDSHGGMWC
jgi:hypothetical protein